MAPAFPRPPPILLLGLLWGLALLIPTLGLSQNYIKAVGTELPPWCLFESVPTIKIREDMLQLYCSSACGRSANCSFFCYNSEVCNIFYGQMDPNFQNISDPESISYDACFTTWKGDKLNILTPQVPFHPPAYMTSPQIVKDGIFCGKGSDAYVSMPSNAANVIFDFGKRQQVSFISHYVYDAAESAPLLVVLGDDKETLQYSPIKRERLTEATEGTVEEFVFDPPAFGKYLGFFRTTGVTVTLILGEVTVYE